MHFPSRFRGRLLVAALVFPRLIPAATDPAPKPAPAAPPPAVAPVLPVPAATVAPPADTKSVAIENAVVKVFSTMRQPDLYKPWSKQSPVEATGTGVIIDRHRILTNAHVVLYASQVRVQANQA